MYARRAIRERSGSQGSSLPIRRGIALTHLPSRQMRGLHLFV